MDTYYPQVGKAVVNVLQGLGVDVSFPENQTCCGLPAHHAGFQQEAREVAVQFMDTFEGDGYVVVPSGSCAAMIKRSFTSLFQDDPELRERAEQLAARTYEFSAFIANVLEPSDLHSSFSGKLTYQDVCHLLRGLGVTKEPRALVGQVEGAEFVEMKGSDRCCGYGDLFALRQPLVAEAIVAEKADAIEASGADAVVACDMGCLMYIGQALAKRGSRVRPMHLAELLDQQAP